MAASTQKRQQKKKTGASNNPKRKRRLNLKKLTAFLFVTALLVAGAVFGIRALLTEPSGNGTADSSGTGKKALFGIQSIVVEGCTQYSDEEVEKAGGVTVGQSLLTLSKKKVAQKVLDAFPYVEQVTVSNPSLSEVKISIVEAEPLGLVPFENGWLLISKKGKGLELLDSSSERLGDYRRLTCTLENGAGVANPSLPERTIRLALQMGDYFDKNSVEGVTSLNLSNYADLRFVWKDQITVRLGSETDMEAKLAYFQVILQRTLDSRGQDAKGQIDLSMYSGDSPQGVFTPQELLTPEQTDGSETASSGTVSTGEASASAQ